MTACEETREVPRPEKKEEEEDEESDEEEESEDEEKVKPEVKPCTCKDSFCNTAELKLSSYVDWWTFFLLTLVVAVIVIVAIDLAMQNRKLAFRADEHFTAISDNAITIRELNVAVAGPVNKKERGLLARVQSLEEKLSAALDKIEALETAEDYDGMTRDIIPGKTTQQWMGYGYKRCDSKTDPSCPPDGLKQCDPRQDPYCVPMTLNEAMKRDTDRAEQQMLDEKKKQDDAFREKAKALQKQMDEILAQNEAVLDKLYPDRKKSASTRTDGAANLTKTDSLPVRMEASQRLPAGMEIRIGGERIMKMQKDCNLVVYEGTLPLWASNTMKFGENCWMEVSVIRHQAAVQICTREPETTVWPFVRCVPIGGTAIELANQDFVPLLEIYSGGMALKAIHKVTGLRKNTVDVVSFKPVSQSGSDKSLS